MIANMNHDTELYFTYFYFLSRDFNYISYSPAIEGYIFILKSFVMFSIEISSHKYICWTFYKYKRHVKSLTANLYSASELLAI